MQAIHVPTFIAPEHKRRAAEVKSAEEKWSAAMRTPDFIRQGLGACAAAENMDDFTNDSQRGKAGMYARQRAAVLCSRCPFAAECLPWAEATEQSGVFGGVWLVNGKKKEERYAA